MSENGSTETTTGQEHTDERLYTKTEVESRIRGIVTQVTERDARLSELEKQLSSIATERETKERDELQQKEEWKTLLEKETAKFGEERTALQQQLDEIKQSAESERIDRSLEQSGIADPIVRAGVKVQLSGAVNEDGTQKTVEVFLAELRESSPHLFTGNRHTVSTTNAAAGVSASRSSLSDDVADQWLRCGDPEKETQARIHFRTKYQLTT